MLVQESMQKRRKKYHNTLTTKKYNYNYVDV